MEQTKSLSNVIMTVSGPIAPETMGLTLPHEHVMSTFGAEPGRYPDYPIDDLLKVVLPYLKKVKELGCQTVLDCTSAYFGRHPELLRRISQESGMQILTNTGYYGAGNDRYVPSHAWEEGPDEIAARWVHEWVDGIDETGVRPGFIKTAVDGGPLSEIDRKLMKAAILAHKQTGLTIQTHTGDNAAAVEAILAMLKVEKVHGSAWVWVHAHQLENADALLEAARSGAWISLDGVNAGNAEHVLKLLEDLRAGGFLKQVLLSHDGNSYRQGNIRPYDYILTDFSKFLIERGFSPVEIERMMVINPMHAFTVKIRPVPVIPVLPA